MLFPTILFISKLEFDELINNNIVEDYHSLVQAGIIFNDPNLLNNHLQSIWNDIDKWWYSFKVQKTREDFCFKYARSSKNPIKELNNILNS